MADDPEHEYYKLRRGDKSSQSSDINTDNASAGASTETKSIPKKPDTEPPLDENIDAAEAERLKEEGNALFRQSSWAAAADMYTQAASSAHAPPEARAVYLANRAACRLKLSAYTDVVKDTTAALALRPDYRKALVRRREAREKLSDFRGALEDARALDEHPTQIARLSRAAEQKEKKDREEAMESLKGLGNSLLSNFGMSLDDFSMEQDPSTGSYSINMRNKQS